jgi:hypothetical protein
MRRKDPKEVVSHSSHTCLKVIQTVTFVTYVIIEVGMKIWIFYDLQSNVYLFLKEWRAAKRRSRSCLAVNS